MGNAAAGFMRLEDMQKQSPSGKKEHKQYRGVYYLDESGENNDYQLGVRMNGISGTRVPKAKEHGGVEGSESPFGLVILGKVIGRDEAVMGDVTFPGSENKSETPAMPAPVPVPASADLNAEIERLMAAPKPAPPVYAESDSPRTTRAEIPISIASPTFGTFKGKYREMQITDEFIVLGFSPDDNAFTPPVRPEDPEELVLRCMGKVFPVFYTGIEFTLERYGVTLQVFARKQE